jgi:hypothetical protein
MSRRPDALHREAGRVRGRFEEHCSVPVIGSQLAALADNGQLANSPKDVLCRSLICVIRIICGCQRLCGGFVNSPESHGTE